MSGDTIGTVLVLAVMTAVFYGIFKAFKGVFGGRGKIAADGPLICPHCGTRGSPATHTRGSTGIELVLWLCFIIPGLIYSMWRLGSKQPVCPSCRQPGMLAVTTPRGRELVQQFTAAAHT